MRRQRLELTWVGKDERPRLEPRILLEDPELSYASAERVSENDIFDNRLIFGDNLLALKALEQEFAGKVKCIYIDPPFNTGQAFENYDDGMEHSAWLTMLRDRVELLHRLLAPSGMLFVHLDDNEQAYAKVLLDEVFGRHNFLNQIAWERSAVAGLGQGGKFLVNVSEYVLVYAREFSEILARKPKILRPFPEKTLQGYNRVLHNPGNRQLVEEFPSRSTGELIRIYRHEEYEIGNISWGKRSPVEVVKEYLLHFSKMFRTFLVQKENSFQHDLISRMNRGSLYSVEYVPSRGKRQGELTTNFYLNGELFAWLRDIAQIDEGQIIKNETLSDFWPRDLISNAARGEGGVSFDRSKKPEKLISVIIDSCTGPGDIVLDSFAGSGTTGAVAQKMGRRWIMIELGNHCNTHIIPRMKQVIDGSDQGGISKTVGWKGGGGFRYYKLAPSLLKQDRWGRWVINDKHNPEMLAEAICKLEGYRYCPSDSLYWLHGQSTERAFIYVTTQTLTHEQLLDLSEEVGPDRTLLVSAMAFRGTRDQDYPNLTLKKIPSQVLNRCEWGKDDYSLKVENLPMAAKKPPTTLFEDDEAFS